MKTAKIMLCSLVVIAVVGGALAFKAHPYSFFRIYCQSVNGECKIPITGITTVEDGGSPRANPCTTFGAGVSFFSLTQTTLPCQLNAEAFYNIED